MHNQIASHLSSDDKTFLRAIGFVPPPTKISPAGSDATLFDELLHVMAPQIFPAVDDVLEVNNHE